MRLRARRRAPAANGKGNRPHPIDNRSANAALGSPFATPHLPPLPPQLLLLLDDDEVLLQLPQLLPPLVLLLLHEPHELLLDDPPLDDPPEHVPPPPPLDELDEHPPPPPPPLDELDEHESQLVPPQPLELFELAHVESHDSELLQLGPEQLQFGDASQLLLLHDLPQLTSVVRGGSLLVPASTPGPGYEPLGLP